VICRLESGDVGCWDTETGAESGRLVGAGAILAIDRGGQRALCRRAAGLGLWDLDMASPVRELVLSGVTNAALTADGRYALVGVGALELWDLERGELVRRIERTIAEDRESGPIAMSPDGSFAFGTEGAGWRHGWATVWSLVDGLRLSSASAGGDRITLAAFLDGRRLITAQSPGGLLKWNDKGVPARVFGFDEGELAAFDVSPDGRTLIVGEHRGSLAVYDLALRKRIAGRDEARCERVVGLCVTAGDRQVVAATADGSIRTVDLASGEVVATVATEPVSALQVTAGGDVVVLHPAGDKEVVCARWNRDTRHRGFDIAAPAVLGPGGEVIAHIAGAVIELLDVETGGVLRTIDLPAPATWVAFAPDGRAIVTGTKGSTQIAIWETASGQLVDRIDLAGVNFLAMSADLRWISVEYRGLLYERAETPTCQSWCFGDHVGVRAFSPDCRILAFGGISGRFSPEPQRTVWVWDLIRRQRLATFEEAHEAAVTALAFDSTSTRLVTGAEDGTVRVWALDPR
jgi:WD40 repeat protein